MSHMEGNAFIANNFPLHGFHILQSKAGTTMKKALQALLKLFLHGKKIHVEEGGGLHPKMDGFFSLLFPHLMFHTKKKMRTELKLMLFIQKEFSGREKEGGDLLEEGCQCGV
jgi:hypothetical protein